MTPSIIQKIFGLFGYAKIPKGVVEASLHQTSLLESVLQDELSVKNREFVKMAIEYAKAMTRFLSSGRLLQ